MNINGVGNNSPIQKIVAKPVMRETPVEAPKQHPLLDKLELSGASHVLAALKSNDVRAEKVAAMKAQIEAGRFETDARIDGSIERLLDDLAD